MKRFVYPIVLASAFAITLPAESAQATAFAEIAEHYEAIRQELIKDSTDGVTAHAATIRKLAAGLESDFSATRAGVPEGQSNAVRELLGEVIDRAEALAEAIGLAQVRGALAELTKPLVRWQSHVTGERPIVVYCAMEKKSWLQPDEPVGNPYAPSMLRCGEVVAR